MVTTKFFVNRKFVWLHESPEILEKATLDDMILLLAEDGQGKVNHVEMTIEDETTTGKGETAND